MVEKWVRRGGWFAVQHIQPGAGDEAPVYGGQQIFLVYDGPAADVRGYAAEIYRFKDAERFRLTCTISKEEVASKSGLKIHSIEGNQLLKDPLTGKWHFYLSGDIGKEFVWGGATGRHF